MCIVTGCSTILIEPITSRLRTTREYEFIYWNKIGKTINVCNGTLTSSRLVRARPKRDDWEGTLHSLTLDNVEPVR